MVRSEESHSTTTLSMLFFPLMAQGHMLPMLDIAKLFALRGVEATILTTPANAALLQPSVDRANYSLLRPIRLRLVPFPSDAAGLPEGCENLSSIPPRELPALRVKFFDALARLRGPFDWVMRELLPDCVVTDMFLPWTYDAAAQLGVPRLVFHGTSFFSLCVGDSLRLHGPPESLPGAEESSTLVIPGLPHRVEMLKSQIPVLGELTEIFSQMGVSESKSYGVVVNSFYELEPDYARHYREVVGRRAWHVGPVALCNRDTADKSGRGLYKAAAAGDCLKWLDSKSAGSVLYVCFGSMSDFSTAQLREMALGLEASSHPFVWVVRDGDEWIPEGFEERVEGRGLVMKGWAPQILVLNHPSVGGFLTHCGWNSSLEGISAGLPLATFPLFAEQFYNERLIVDVLRIGVSVGAREYARNPEERGLVGAATIKKVADEVMGSAEAAAERRKRARELGETARRAVEEGGSSYKDMGNLIQELMVMKKNARS